LIGLHLLAIAYYTWVKKQGLVKAMWTGDKEFDDERHRTTARDNAQVRWDGLVVLGIYAAVVTLFMVLAAAT
jgi:hypothetical protein